MNETIIKYITPEQVLEIEVTEINMHRFFYNKEIQGIIKESIGVNLYGVFTKNKRKKCGYDHYLVDLKFNAQNINGIMRGFAYVESIGKVKKGYSFSDFILDIDCDFNKEMFGRKHKWVTSNQIECCCDEKGDVILDFIGRFEKINESWKSVCKKIGINRVLPHVKHSKSKGKKIHYSDYYNDKTKDFVANRFSKDIEYFGYSF